jgi:flagellar biosynthesis protein FlhA
MNRFTSKGIPPIVLCSANTRIHFRKIMERFFPNIIVLAHNEIAPNVNITSLGMVEI